MTRIGVVTFPGSLDDHDALRAVQLTGAEAVPLWHGSDSIDGVDAIILPGGFSYGDYLRCGAIARFSPIMDTIIDAANKGMPVLGICNGFQLLCEAHLLEGAMIRNAGQQFICRDERLRVETIDTVWTAAFTKGDEITIVLKNGEGNYQATPETLRKLEDNDQVVFRYLDNPNCSANDIAGITNERGNVVGLMPHPEHNVEPLTSPTTDGARFFESVIGFLGARV
ncbi:phosphoribosylformylglycinamidine synthase subunit PurQ [Tessaracoccus sp. MC1865]|uniref:phosphoribosylformylglycinamidine synthase subunit PurQ n=1 Tax=Tessaracoccus sp. MC1865 TaxID=2760310 RepID=UPI001601D015|nr:phosphoribosylformylglycinamidine synthase subunit PurQ [Tessaracoccus sp. MC1865]MBB1483921.1 phosphoribosylformylglycinamidine synthase subunit PurQ [Tessaracoccus sp. MC1865]QTO36972.1 phosphoribosylformylglycinamidine synthase subunit PurQ [Tessaracoccus sp. MC1865]